MIDGATLQADLAKANAFANAFKTGLGMLPTAMASAQELLPVQGQGAARLQIAKNFVQGALAWEGHAADVVEKVWAQFEPIIATLVTLYTGNPTVANLLGLTVFTKPLQAA